MKFHAIIILWFYLQYSSVPKVIHTANSAFENETKVRQEPEFENETKVRRQPENETLERWDSIHSKPSEIKGKTETTLREPERIKWTPDLKQVNRNELLFHSTFISQKKIYLSKTEINSWKTIYYV